MREDQGREGPGRPEQAAGPEAPDESQEPGALLRDVKADEYHLDGNAVGGLLSEVFGREVTGASATCAACGATGAVGTLIAYGQGPRSVLTCPDCAAVLFTVVQRPGAFRLTFARLGALDLQAPPPGSASLRLPERKPSRSTHT